MKPNIALEPTAYSLRSAPASSSGSPQALGCLCTTGGEKMQPGGECEGMLSAARRTP